MCHMRGDERTFLYYQRLFAMRSLRKRGLLGLAHTMSTDLSNIEQTNELTACTICLHHGLGWLTRRRSHAHGPAPMGFRSESVRVVAVSVCAAHSDLANTTRKPSGVPWGLTPFPTRTRPSVDSARTSCSDQPLGMAPCASRTMSSSVFGARSIQTTACRPRLS